MEAVFTGFLFVHIVSGTVGLLAGLLGMTTKKGTKNHTLSGKIFLCGMAGVFVTSIYMSIAHSNWFLFFVGFFSFYLAATGDRALTTYRTNKGELIDFLIYGLGICAGIGLLLMSIFFVKKGFAIVPAVFGLIAGGLALADLKSVIKGYIASNMYKAHGIRMAGACTATITAFVVVNIQMEQDWVLWLTPTFVIIPIAIYQVKKFSSQLKTI